MADALAIRELRDDERAWAAALYQSIDFAATPPGSVALVAERAGARIGLGRLVGHAPGVVEMGGIWTDEAARGGGVARAMVTALIARQPGAGARLGGARPGGARPGGARLWCIPFVHLTAFYRSFGFVDAAPPWPTEIAAKVADCVAHAQDVAVLAM